MAELILPLSTRQSLWQSSLPDFGLALPAAMDPEVLFWCLADRPFESSGVLASDLADRIVAVDRPGIN